MLSQYWKNKEFYSTINISHFGFTNFIIADCIGFPVNGGSDNPQDNEIFGGSNGLDGPFTSDVNGDLFGGGGSNGGGGIFGGASSGDFFGGGNGVDPSFGEGK